MTGPEKSSLLSETTTSSSPGGLHNLVTGLTGQSPGLSPSQGSLRSPAPSILEQTSPPRAPASAIDRRPDVPAPSLFAPATGANSSLSHDPTTSSSTRPPISNISSSRPASSRRNIRSRTGPGPERVRHDMTAAKEVDDPSQPAGRNSPPHNSGGFMPIELTRLFALTSMATPSRQPSFEKLPAGTTYTRAGYDTAAPLPHHLWTRGFLDGRHSDITVHAFSNAYTLHRILLDRAPFFSSALSEPWFESTAKEITLHPQDVDPNITQSAFELALKRLYGSAVPAEEEKEAVGLFAVGSWLEMKDLIESSLDILLRRMTTADVAHRIRLVTTSYYGQHGVRLLSAAKALLYREGWEMPVRHWDGIPGDIVRDVVGADGFFVPGEWERWKLAKKLLERRLQQTGQSSGLSVGKGKGKAVAAPKIGLVEVVAINKVDQLQAVYAHPEVAPLIELLDEGIHYVHMTFEQLQRVRQERDMFGVAPVSEEALTNALWMSMELRGKVMNASEANSELGIKLQARRPRRSFNKRVAGGEEMKKSHSNESEDSGENQGSSSGHAANETVTKPNVVRPRKFWIPQVDSTKVVGDTSDLSSGRFAPLAFRIGPNAQELPAAAPRRSLEAEPPRRSLEGAPETPTSPPPNQLDGLDTESYPPIYYTKYPPFRFSVEFPDPRLLKDKKRVYSHTVEYLGSHWNIYIQKIRSTKNVQLGVYLHRAKEREGEKKIRGTAGPRSVDEAIGQLEREMLLRRTERRLRRQQQYEAQLEGDEESSSGGENSSPHARPLAAEGASNNAIGGPSATTSQPHRHRHHHHRPPTKRASQSPITGSGAAIQDQTTLEGLGHRGSSDDDDDNDDDDDADDAVADTAAGVAAPTYPAMPAYVDARPTIKTYFKIYSPGKGGLSVYESAPDEFNFSQSWGWRSSMILDDGSCNLGGTGEQGGSSRGRDGRLRYSVVLGNV